MGAIRLRAAIGEFPLALTKGLPMDYDKPKLERLDYNHKVPRPSGEFGLIAISPKAVLAIVQSAFDDTGLEGASVNDLKSRIFDEATQGRIEQAIYCAIIGAIECVRRNNDN